MKPLDNETVARILHLATTTDMTQGQIGDECGVSQPAVSRILTSAAMQTANVLKGRTLSRRYRSKPVRPNMIRMLEQQWRIQNGVCIRPDCPRLAARGMHCHAHAQRTKTHIHDTVMSPGLRAAWEAYRETIRISLSPRATPIGTPDPKRRDE